VTVDQTKGFIYKYNNNYLIPLNVKKSECIFILNVEKNELSRLLGRFPRGVELGDYLITIPRFVNKTLSLTNTIKLSAQRPEIDGDRVKFMNPIGEEVEFIIDLKISK